MFRPRVQPLPFNRDGSKSTDIELFGGVWGRTIIQGKNVRGWGNCGKFERLEVFERKGIETSQGTSLREDFGKILVEK
jgi:hypothetical protein